VSQTLARAAAAPVQPRSVELLSPLLLLQGDTSVDKSHDKDVALPLVSPVIAVLRSGVVLFFSPFLLLLQLLPAVAVATTASQAGTQTPLDATSVVLSSNRGRL
jgi:hypothetical protein